MRCCKGRIKYIICFLTTMGVLFGYGFNAQAVSPDSLWLRGNRFFAQQQYIKALDNYIQLENAGFENAALFYNIGNTYYRMGNTAFSILYYERALFNNPTNGKIKENLILAQARVKSPIKSSESVFFISWWQSFLLQIAPQIWAWLMLISFSIGLWLLYKKLKQSNRLKFSGRWLSLLTIICLLSGLLFYYSYQLRTHSDRAVVMQDSSFFQDRDHATSDGRLPAGTVVNVKNGKGGWSSVVLPNNVRAWVKSGTLTKVQKKY